MPARGNVGIGGAEANHRLYIRVGLLPAVSGSWHKTNIPYVPNPEQIRSRFQRSLLSDYCPQSVFISA